MPFRMFSGISGMSFSLSLGIPKDNEKDIPDIPENIRKGMTFHPVKDMDEVIEKVFGSKFRRGRKPTAKTKSRKTSVTTRPSATTLN